MAENSRSHRKRPLQRVAVAVSPENARLREVQSHLNHFLWSSEIAFGYVLQRAPRDFPNPAARAGEALADVLAEAWYPTNQGRIKFVDTVGNWLEHVRGSTLDVYRAVMVFFAAAFENYLEDRLRPAGINPRRGWGPYVRSLNTPQLMAGAAPLRLPTVLRADICRRLRNAVVHPPFHLPRGLKAPGIAEMRASLEKEVLAGLWLEAKEAAALKKVMDEAFDRVIGEAERQCRQARAAGKELPVELFYALFNFTSLDSLAFELEEALILVGTKPSGVAFRRSDAVQRQDLVLKRVARNAAGARGATSD